MKISKSKQELARIISENGGWRDMAGSAAQCAGGEISFWHDVATKRHGEDWRGSYLGSCEDIEFTGVKLPNWHQTILSSEEYFHLYPSPDAKPRFCDSVMRSIPEPDEQVWTNPPTIEQLAAEYRNANDYAESKQREADDAKADADAKLKALEIAGEALGLLVSPITAKQEAELAITDWRDLQTGDLVWVEEEGGRVAEGEYEVLEVEVPDYDGKRTIRIRGGEGGQFWINYENGWRFIRRP